MRKPECCNKECIAHLSNDTCKTVWWDLCKLRERLNPSKR